MTDAAFLVRAGQSGAILEGTPGHVLAFDADGKTLRGVPQSSGGGLTSFNGRTDPAVVPELGDYPASLIDNDSAHCPGDTTADALDDLDTRATAAQAAATAAAAAAAAAQSTANTAEADAQTALTNAAAASAAAAAAQTTANTGVTNAATADAKAVAAQQPFRGTYYVDPTFAGTQRGSASNPFTSVTAAIAAAVAAGLTRAIFFLAPGANTVENITFPATGDWEVACEQATAALVTTITGNVDVTATASARRNFTNVQVTGNVSGNCSAGTLRVMLTAAIVQGTFSLTQTGAGVVRMATRGGVFDAQAGGNIAACLLVGAVAVAGTFWGANAVFSTSVSVAASSSFTACDMPPTTFTTGAGNVDLFFYNCSNTVGGSLAFTASSGAARLRPDISTLAEFMRVGINTTGAVTLRGQIGGPSVSVQTTNVGASGIAGKTPPGLMVIECCLTLLTNAGATAGTAQLNVNYTDMTGTLVTEAVPGAALNVAGAVGSKARGSLPFSQNGATVINFTVTGITNATSLTYQCDVAVRQAS